MSNAFDYNYPKKEQYAPSQQQQQQFGYIVFTDPLDIAILKFTQLYQTSLHDSSNNTLKMSYTRYGYITGVYNPASTPIQSPVINANEYEYLTHQSRSQAKLQPMLDYMVLDRLLLTLRRAVYPIERTLVILKTSGYPSLKDIRLVDIINNERMAQWFIQLSATVYQELLQNASTRWATIPVLQDVTKQQLVWIREMALVAASNSYKCSLSSKSVPKLTTLVVPFDLQKDILTHEEIALLDKYKVDAIHPFHRFMHLVCDATFNPTTIELNVIIDMPKLQPPPTVASLPLQASSSLKQEHLDYLYQPSSQSQSPSDNSVVINTLLLPTHPTSTYNLDPKTDPSDLGLCFTTKSNVAHSIQAMLNHIQSTNEYLIRMYRLEMLVTLKSSKQTFDWLLLNHSRMLAFVNLVEGYYHKNRWQGQLTSVRISVINRINSAFNSLTLYLAKQMSAEFTSSMFRDTKV